MLSVIARQFGRPRGLLGRFVGRGMARGNADFNRWLVREVGTLDLPGVERIVELGPGPGVGLQETLRAFPYAHVWGVDLSPVMLAQSRRRNLAGVRSGRLVMVQGDAGALGGLAPVDLVMASHVLYFWHRPDAEIALIHGALRRGGWIALGYQLRQNMPSVAQRNFPREGHVLYDGDDEIGVLLERAGFGNVRFTVKGPSDAPEGRLALAEA
jgi:SAM-dependent methyltransferase